jgi:sec-independent protein translocase protein TatB
VFDVGFSEVLLIAVVALLVLGPERLPKAARFTGLWVRRARSQWDSVRSELERELAAEDLKRSVEEVRRQAGQIAQDMGSNDAALKRDAQALEEEIRSAAPIVTTPTTPTTPTTQDNATPVSAIAPDAADAAAEPEHGRSIDLEAPLPAPEAAVHEGPRT